MPHPFWLLLLPPPWCKPPSASAALRIKGKYSEEKYVCLSGQYGLLTHLRFWFRGGRRGNRGLPIPAPHSLSGVPAISACPRQRKQSSVECTDWEALTSGWIDFSLSQTWFFPPFFFLSGGHCLEGSAESPAAETQTRPVLCESNRADTRAPLFCSYRWAPTPNHQLPQCTRPTLRGDKKNPCNGLL